MRLGVIIQARTGSTRLPGKVLKQVTEYHTVLQCVVERARLSKMVSFVALATTSSAGDDVIVQLANKWKIPVYRGSETDVLSRYIEAMQVFSLDSAVRVTADCPLIEPSVIDDVVRLYLKSPADYVFIEGYPRGTGDAELVTLSGLRYANEKAGNESYYREHVITYLLEHPTDFRILIESAPSKYNLPQIRLCVDEDVDLEVVRRIYQYFAPRLDIKLDEVITFLTINPQIAQLNQHVRQKTV